MQLPSSCSVRNNRRLPTESGLWGTPRVRGAVPQCGLILARRFLERFVAVLPHDVARGRYGFRQHVKEGPDASAAEDDAAAVFVRLHAVLDTGGRQQGLQAQGIAEFLG